MQRLWLGAASLPLCIGLVSCAPSSQTASQLAAQSNDAAPAPALASAKTAIGRVYVANRQMSLMPPTGFTAMKAAEIRKQYPGKNPPSYVFSNANGSASIAITFTQQPLTLKQLPELQKFMSKHMEKTVPGIKWIARDFLAINGGSWVKLEATSQKQQQQLHSDMYFTVFQGKMLGVSFSANIEQYAQVKSAFEQSRNSIQIAPEVL